MPWRKPPTSAGFQEAIAQWHLDVRTEVKKSSSLPTAMFDACDPMLEARLAETAEAMLACLQEPKVQVDTRATARREKRTELVSQEELRRLPASIAAGGDVHVDLDHGIDAEFLGVLADCCAEAEGTARQSALDLLAREFPADHTADLQTLTQQLWQRVRTTQPGASATDDAQLAEICRRIAAAVNRATAPLPPPSPPEPPAT